MRISRAQARAFRAALLFVPLALFAFEADAQTTCTSRTECVEKGIPFTNQSPGVQFQPLSDTVYESKQRIEVSFYDAWGLDEYSGSLTIVGGTIATGPVYGYSPLGQVLRDSIDTGAFGWEHQYTYDGIGRVGSWELHKFGRKRVCYNIRDCTMIDTDSLAQSQSFSWDAVGNPTGAARDPGNRLRAHGGFSFDYDVDGNLVRKYNGSSNQTFTWNSLGQLTGTDRPGTGAVTYQYDGLGRRIRRQDHTGAVTHYVYDETT